MNVRVIRRPATPSSDFAPHLSAVVRRIYAARGLKSDEELTLGLDRLLPVGSLPGLEQATSLLLAHYAPGSRILVIGDFDADGATSSALMVRTLRRLKFAEVDYLVPNRARYGYGLTPEIVKLAALGKPSLIVTVDNGISSQEGVLEANRQGIQVLITDHHLPGADLPLAAAIVNPNLPGCDFGSRALAGVGVAFYVMAALVRRMQSQAYPNVADVSVAECLDLVALGTVADLVPLDRNNRVLVSQGLKRIRAGRCVPGILALLGQAGRKHDQLVASDLGFAVAPRLNAAGRLDDMSIGIECLLTDDVDRAQELAARLSRLNEERREIEKKMQAEAMEAARKVHVQLGREAVNALCLYDETWHQGVVGLVASRIKDRVHRPVVALARAEDTNSQEMLLRGSARSVPGVHIRDVLDAVATRHPGLIDKFGGHAMAAGLTIKHSALELFKKAFVSEVGRWLDTSAQGIFESDGELLPEEMTLRTAFDLRDAGPWGQGFPEPAFDGHFTLIESRIVGERHLKLRVRPETSGEHFDAIAFNFFLEEEPARRLMPQGRAHLVYRLDVNEYLGVRRLQLIVEHIA